MLQSNNNLTHTDTMYKPNNVLIHLQNKSRDGSDKTILKRDNTNNINKSKAKDLMMTLIGIMFRLKVQIKEDMNGNYY